MCCILYKRKHEECLETVKIGYNDNGEEKCDLCNERENCKQENIIINSPYFYQHDAYICGVN